MWRCLTRSRWMLFGKHEEGKFACWGLLRKVEFLFVWKPKWQAYGSILVALEESASIELYECCPRQKKPCLHRQLLRHHVSAWWSTFPILQLTIPKYQSHLIQNQNTLIHTHSLEHLNQFLAFKTHILHTTIYVYTLRYIIWVLVVKSLRIHIKTREGILNIRIWAIRPISKETRKNRNTTQS